MKRWLWILLAVCISTGVYYTIRYGLRPKPIPVMNPTDFTRLDQIGVVTYRRLRTDVRSERLLVLGTAEDAPEDDQVWAGFIKAAVADKEKIIYFTREGMQAAPPGNDYQTIVYDQAALDSGEFFKTVKAQLKSGQLVIVHSPTKEASHLVKASLARKLERFVQHPVLSLSTLRFALNEEESDGLQCLTATEDPDGNRRLGCAAQRVARHFMRKKLDPTKIWAVIERHGLKEYLVFIHTPQAQPGN